MSSYAIGAAGWTANISHNGSERAEDIRRRLKRMQADMDAIAFRTKPEPKQQVPLREAA